MFSTLVPPSIIIILPTILEQRPTHAADRHLVIDVVMSWSNEADDARILPAAESIINRFGAAARARHLDHPFLYQNYASRAQHVFGSYGTANLERLRAVSKKYDPERVWQKLQPGYFKLW